MTLKNSLLKTLLGGGCLIAAACSAATPETSATAPAQTVAHAQPEALQAFIDKMAGQHHFDKTRLHTLFQSVELKPGIIKAMTRPAEAMPWFKYRKIFLTEKRIDAGAGFWRDHESALTQIERQTGVPAAIVVAIIGVETFYGQNTGSHRVIDALSTLAFDFPKRSPFFLSELENFLLLCREEAIDPLDPTGSYAGAMGLPQFMPSSYRAYAADFDGDGRRDIWHNPADVIASVANYFVKHHWQPGADIAFQVAAEGQDYQSALGGDLKPDLTLARLKSLKIKAPENLDSKQKVKLLAFEQEQGQDLWLGLDNFYVITRYNHSPLYAMAVYQLSQAITDKKASQS
ncbi:MAG: lytic murein transglycosylase B [Gammaproteobacteria bacterium HGW-Gammaproteobacteria-3]|nr:MAG: lytic murein transglycosylase B [Gammaproteobacteria bacterium HGW-Gammaproteobacteria-3]